MSSPHCVIQPGDEGLEILARQAWGEAIASGDYRLVVNPTPQSGWATLREYTVLGSGGRPELLVPKASPRITRRVLTAYGGLRRLRPRIARQVAGWTAQVGLPIGRQTIAVQEATARESQSLEPLAVIEGELGMRLVAALGVRRGANGKATLHLFDHVGRPAGLAKLSWNALTREFIDTESTVLEHLDGTAGAFSVPRLMNSGTIGANPYLVAAPLPSSVRQSSRSSGLTPGEVTGLFPIVRRARAVETGQVRSLLTRLAHYRVGVPDSLRALWHECTAALSSSTTELSVAQRWHGDLVPWNVGRDATGRPWLWDWESSEEDVVAGLDVLHWHVNTAHAGRRLSDILRPSLLEVTTSLQALGHGERAREVVAALYAMTIAERAAGLADAHGGWSRVRVDQSEVGVLLSTARQML